MSAPVSGMQPSEQPSAETLLSALKSIDAADRRKHASVLNYWLSIRGDKELPPLHDFDPLEISDAAPNSLLLELIGGGEDAEIRHLGEQLKALGEAERIIDAPRPSMLASVAGKLSIVAISRNFLAFEDEFASGEATTRCWVTLLPLSAAGAWVDYVYGYVTFEAVPAEVEEAAEAPPAEAHEDEPAVAEAEVQPEPEEAPDAEPDEAPEAEQEPVSADKRPGFSKLFDAIVGTKGYYGSPMTFEASGPAVLTVEQPLAPAEPEPEAEAELAPEPEEDVVEPVAAAEEVAAEAPAVEEAEQPTNAEEGSLQSELAQVRGKADEARLAKLQSNTALYEGLSAAYDFALDAEERPEDYLKLVEAHGLKIQLRSPMTPVIRLAFDGMCDDAMISQLEAVLAWALEQELPRGSLAEKIHAAGGIGPILTGEAKAA